MNITYVSSFNAKDIRSYSGTGFYIPHELEKSGDKIDYIGNLSSLNPFFYKLIRKYYSIFHRKNYLIEREPRILRKWGRHIERNLPPDTEIVLGCSGQPFAFLQTDKIKVFWADAVFSNMVDYYKVYSNLHKTSRKNGNEMERLSLKNADLVIFTSEWAKKEAISYYNIPESKVLVIPYGANIETDYTLEDIEHIASQKSTSTCNLLFIGVEWERKGGDIALQVTEELNAMGIKAKLSIIGIDPGKEISSRDYVKSHGFISKSTPKGEKLLKDLISESHFLLMPARADCTSIVFNEVNAHGIPVISSNEGGITTIVRDGINGYTLDRNTDPANYANLIKEICMDRKKYIQLSKSSYNEYITRLNWSTSIRILRKNLKSILQDSSK